jgi:molybdopterin synthase catalytic subunit
MAIGATFVGVVRDHHEGKKVKRLFYDSYRSMSEKEIAAIITDIKKKIQVDEIRVLHRVGWLEVGEAAVAIWVSAAHREEAFLACCAMIERIKKDVPIWKNEIYTDGSNGWVMCEHKESVGV